MHFIFDSNDVERSYKTEIRTRRLRSKQSIAYYVTDSSRIKNASMKALLSSSATEDELSTYLAVSLIEYTKDAENSYVIA